MDYYLGEIRAFPYGRAPSDWVPCDGRLLAISQYMPLFSIIGTCFGGDGKTTFAVPDLRGRTAVHPQSSDKSRITLSHVGQTAGAEVHTLVVDEIPAHNHCLYASTSAGTSTDPSGKVWAAGPKVYGPASNPAVLMNAAAVTYSNGKNYAHNNMQPYFAIYYCISTAGIYPERDES